MSSSTAAPPTSLTERVLALAKTLQFSWFAGHLTLLLAAFRYFLSYVTFNYYSKTAQFTYRLAFVAAAATYGIVVFKAYRARMKTQRRAFPPEGPVGLLKDENVQYLVMAFVWLFSKQVPLALLPFCVYSTFHFLSYVRTNIIPAVQPKSSATTNGAGAKSASSAGLADHIGNFVKSNYDRSMFLVAVLEVLLWFRLFISAVTFTKGSWILLGIYSVFLRTRIAQSKFLSDAISHLTGHVDNVVAQQNMPPAAKNAWASAKGLARSAHDATDLNKYSRAASTQAQKTQ